MALFKFLFVLIALQSPQAQEAATTSVPQMVKRINDRYDDFFRYHREREERWNRSRKGVDERKTLLKQREASLEKARKAYVKARKARPSDEADRLRAEAALKERQANHEMLRRRYVNQRDTIEQYLKKGRQIPELKEYDLENY